MSDCRNKNQCMTVLQQAEFTRIIVCCNMYKRSLIDSWYLDLSVTMKRGVILTFYTFLLLQNVLKVKITPLFILCITICRFSCIERCTLKCRNNAFMSMFGFQFADLADGRSCCDSCHGPDLTDHTIQ